MIDLKSKTGLPISFDEKNCKLVVSPPLPEPKYTQRYMRDISGLWYGKPAENNDKPLYFYTLCLALPEHSELLDKAQIMYGIVVIPPGKYDGEYIKTSGQFHPVSKADNLLGYPELYSVIHGRGHYMLQQSMPPFDNVDDAVLVDVEEGESFLVPPNYGHLQINPGNEVLIFSYTMVSNMGSSIYEPYKKNKGAAYFETEDEKGNVKFIKNSNYKNLPELKIIDATHGSQVKNLFNKPIYPYVIQHIDEFEFMVDPRKYNKNWYFK